MRRFYEVTVKYDKLSDKGEQVKYSEQYVVQGIDCTDIENKMLLNIACFAVGNSEVVNIRVSKFIEYISFDKYLTDLLGKSEEEGNTRVRYYNAKLSFVSIDEITSKEKKIAVNYLVSAVSVEQANKVIKNFMRESLYDYVINNIVETKIMDVYLYNE